MLQANYLCTTVLALVWSISMILSKEHHNRHISEVLPDLHFCVLHTVGLSVKLHHLQALVLLQLERFLDVRKPFLSQQITVRHTGHAIAVSFLSTLALTAVAVVMDRALLINLNNFINPVNIYMVSYPKLLAIILTLLVSAVLTNEVHRLNAVNPQPQPHIFMMALPNFQAQQSELQPQHAPPPKLCHLPGLKIPSLQPWVLSESTSVQQQITQNHPSPLQSTPPKSPQYKSTTCESPSK